MIPHLGHVTLSTFDVGIASEVVVAPDRTDVVRGLGCRDTTTTHNAIYILNTNQWLPPIAANGRGSKALICLDVLVDVTVRRHFYDQKLKSEIFV